MALSNTLYYFILPTGKTAKSNKIVQLTYPEDLLLISCRIHGNFWFKLWLVFPIQLAAKEAICLCVQVVLIHSTHFPWFPCRPHTAPTPPWELILYIPQTLRKINSPAKDCILFLIIKQSTGHLWNVCVLLERILYILYLISYKRNLERFPEVAISQMLAHLMGQFCIQNLCVRIWNHCIITMLK